MKHIPIPAKYSVNSISIRFSVVTFILCVLFSLGIGLLILDVEKRNILLNDASHLSATSARYTQQFELLISKKKQIGLAANQIVTQSIQSPHTHFNLTKPYSVLGDKSLRSDDGYSGAFLPEQQFNQDYRRLFAITEHLWRYLGPLVTESFYNYYFITSDGFIRITPKDWALQVESNHQFSDDIYYNIAIPQNNPAREAMWTPVYFDDVLEQWMTSLSIPVYIGDEFIGITGSDFILDDVLVDLSDLEGPNSQYSVFLFDTAGNVLAHPELMEQILSQQGSMNSRLLTVDLISGELKRLTEQVIHTHPQELATKYHDDQEAFQISIRPIESMGWYLAVFKSQELSLHFFYAWQFRLWMILLCISFFVALSTFLVFNQMGLKRIRQLATRVQNISYDKGQEMDLPIAKKDEIGALADALQGMISKFKQLMNGLNNKIEEQEQAELLAKKLSKAVTFSGSGILISNAQLSIEYVNPKLCEMSGFEAYFFLNKPIFSIISPEMEFLKQNIIDDLRQRKHWRGDILLVNSKNQHLWSSMSVAPILQEDQHISHYVCCAQDISFVKESQKRMEQLAYFDVLTGLANRVFFKMQLRKALALSKRGHYSFALVYFDLDEFKRINDTLGHEAGDNLLIEVAHRLQLRLRLEDTIARLGGDEFAVLLSGVKTKEEAAIIVKAIESMLINPILLGSNEVVISASIGVTLAPSDSAEEDTLLKHADLAMYEAKKRGKNTSHFYTEELDQVAKERMIIENELHIAIREQQLQLYFQPQVDIMSKAIVGFEALLRWYHPDKGLIPPHKFIPVAESTGQIVQIGEWVLFESCRVLKRLHSQGFNGKLSVNISGRQLKDFDFCTMLRTVIKSTKVDPSYLELEITESILMKDVEAAIDQLYDFKKLGLHLSIDDFGTGYSSLSYLKRFPVDTLKIDRTFIKDIPMDRDDMEISAAIIAMAQKLNLKLVAEGVETQEQIDFLCRNTCHVIQGYFFSKPMPEADISPFIARFNKKYQRFSTAAL